MTQVATTELHRKYAPILRFNKGENFLPMRVDDMLSYSELYAKDRPQPLVSRGNVTPGLLYRYRQAPEVFVRSVSQGPLLGVDVLRGWSTAAAEMVYRWAAETASSWTEDLARKAYNWFSPKNKPATNLFWWNDLIEPVLRGALESVEPNELPRLILPGAIRSNALENYTKRLPGYTYYYRYIRDGDYYCLQYWFFYSYNDWGHSFGGFNDHEGDWESIIIFFRQDRHNRVQEPPAYIAFADHESRQTKPWDDPDVSRIGTHPQVYVGAGSHASYPQQQTHTLMAAYGLRDFAEGDGPTIDHDQWAHRINLDGVRWMRWYRGSWGTRYWVTTERAKSLASIILTGIPLGNLLPRLIRSEFDLPGVSAPRGPLDPGRPQTRNPVAWAGVPLGPQ